MGWTIEERRQIVVEAALQLAADRGLEHVTLRSAAHAAGLSWESARDVFSDHADLLRAISLTVTTRNIGADELDLDLDGSVEDILEGLLLRLWDRLSAQRDMQLISYELSVLALRRTALRPMVMAQYDNQRDLALGLVEAVSAHHGLLWDRPTEEIARFASTFLDGVSLSWLVDRDLGAARAQVVLLAQVMVGFVRPAGAGGSDRASAEDPR